MFYHLILATRHFLYDRGILKSSTTEIPSLCVGNIALGGTGKTPMTELVIRTLLEDSPYRVLAVLSRGYGRKTKGFQIVSSDGNARIFGDEPLQVKKKFPDVKVAVDTDRVRGAKLLSEPVTLFDKPEVIILDDAFQHRRIKATKNILLTTYDRPFYHDRLVPFGRLRDLRSRALSADMIVVTKCPQGQDEQERERIIAGLKIKNFDKTTCSGVNRAGKTQTVLFATTAYDRLTPVFPDGDARYIHSKNAIVFTAIANDSALVDHLSCDYKIVDHFTFPDHHFFSRSDLRTVERAAKYNPTSAIITTEKDARRLECVPQGVLGEYTRKKLLYAPIRTVMLSAEEHSIFKAFLNGLC